MIGLLCFNFPLHLYYCMSTHIEQLVFKNPITAKYTSCTTFRPLYFIVNVRHLNIYFVEINGTGEMLISWKTVINRWLCAGRLTKEQIKAGYSSLQKIAACVDKGDFGAQLTAACNDFYTRIPHYFGLAHSSHIKCYPVNCIEICNLFVLL